MDLYGFTICIAMIGTVFAQEDFLRESFGSRVSVGKAWDSRETGSLKFLCTSKREKEKEVGGRSYFAKNETQPPMYINLGIRHAKQQIPQASDAQRYCCLRATCTFV